MQKIIQVNTNKHNGIYDITSQVSSIVGTSGVKTGFASVYVQGATAVIMILFYVTDSLFTNVGGGL